MVPDPKAKMDMRDGEQLAEPVEAPVEARPPAAAFAAQIPANAADILDRVAEAFLVLDRQWRIVFANREACRINQKPLEEFLGKTLWEEWPASLGTEVERQYRLAMTDHVEVHFEHRYVDGPYDEWMEIDAYPTPDGLSVFYRDITTRKRAQESLRESEARSRQMIDAIPHIAWLTGPDGSVDYYNQRWYEYSGLTPGETKGWGWETVIHPADVPRASGVWRAAIEAGTESEVEYRLRRADGEYRWHLGRSQPVRDAAGEITTWVGTATDIEERKQAEQQLIRSQEDLQFSISAARLGTFYCDWPLDKISWNDTCKEHFFLPLDAEVDFDVFYSLLHPDDREPTRLAIERAEKNRVEYDVEYRTLASDGRTRWVNAVGRFHYAADGSPRRFDGITIDISARKANEEAMNLRAEHERFLAELADRGRRITDPDAVIADAVRSVGQFLDVGRCVFGDIDLVADTCAIVADYRADSMASIVGVFPFSDFGPFVVAEYMAGRAVSVDDVRLDPMRVTEANAAYEAIGIRAHITAPVVHSSRLVSVIAVHSPTPRRWTPEEVDLLQAVVERTWLTVEVLRQQTALAREAVAARQSEARYRAVIEALTEGITIQNSAGVLIEANAGAERVLGLTRDQMAGRTSADPRWRTVYEDGSLLPGEDHPPMRALRTGQPQRNMMMGIHRPDGQLAWVSANAELIPHPETGEPMGVVTSFFDITAQREAQRDLLARAAREEFLNRVGQALLSSSDPAAIQKQAAALLGGALGADRCYFVTYDYSRDHISVVEEFRRSDLPSLVRSYSVREFEALLDDLLGKGTRALADVRNALSPDLAGVMEGLGLRSVIVAPFLEGGKPVAALFAAMADAPRSWADEEIKLVEAVAVQTRAAVETARVAQREHAIAQELQNALQPAVPDHVRGLSVGSFMRPALDEASVGGDFFDVFPLDKQLYALVIGDVSGKGLAAAQQLALIRNSLRTTLYLYRAPAQAAAALNAIVTAHDLLVGFVTAWVGVFHVATGEIVFCSCGHEPGLVRRTNGDVEMLTTNGPPLGVTENAEYGEGGVTLAPGDALLLYTDGLSEAGPNRRDLLGTDGLTRLLARMTPNGDVQSQAETLVAEAGKFANETFRDDVAVLMARRR